MDERQWLARYAAIALVIVGGLEWLLGRTISRVAAVPTLEGLPRTIIETLGSIGFFLLSVAFMLVVALLVLAYLSLISGGQQSSSRVTSSSPSTWRYSPPLLSPTSSYPRNSG